MGNFERNLPILIKNVNQEILALNASRYDLDWGHECDCEFCDRNQDIPEDTEAEAAELDAKVADLHLLKKRLLAHAKLHGITVPAEEQR